MQGGSSSDPMGQGVPYTPPYVLVPASALQFLPGYAQQMVPAQPGVSAPSHAFAPAPYGSPGYGDMGARHANRANNGFGGGRMPFRHSPQQGPSSPSDESHPDTLAENLQHLSFSSPDKRNRTSNTKRKFKKPCPEELEEARQRTIYVSDLNKGITETELVRWFGVAGHVLECRICSDMNTSKRFAFVEFADKAGFEQGLGKSGEKLNGGVIKVSPSKTPIVPINREFMPRDEKELERCERTVYVNQIDRAVPGSAVEAMFENFCGAIEHVKMKLDKQSNTRIAFIEFKTNDAAKTALGMCGAQLGSSQIRVSPSKTPVRVNT